MNKVIHLYGEVNDNMYRMAVDGLSRCDKNHPIRVQLCTEGGDFYIGLAIYDLLKPYSPTIKCVGCVMSAGTIILQAAGKAVSAPSCQFMIHYGEDSNSSAGEAAHNRRMLKLMVDMMMDKVKVTRRTVKSWFNKETYFGAKKALEVGLIDEILDGTKKENGIS